MLPKEASEDRTNDAMAIPPSEIESLRGRKIKEKRNLERERERKTFLIIGEKWRLSHCSKPSYPLNLLSPTPSLSLSLFLIAFFAHWPFLVFRSPGTRKLKGKKFVKKTTRGEPGTPPIDSRSVTAISFVFFFVFRVYPFNLLSRFRAI